MRNLAAKFSILVLVICSSSFSFGAQLKNAGHWPCMGGNGSGMPSPFAPNTRVELASGENYLLVGTLIQDDSGQYAIQVDLSQMPWLASVERKANPVYPLITTSDSKQRAEIRQWVGSQVIASGKALGQIVGDDIDDAQYVISLVLEKDGITTTTGFHCVGGQE